jgi:putative spermidine/putrescine transport system substrate-binding protein
VNDDLVATPPTSWADLKKPDYANQFALSGDPRASNQAIQAVYAAGLASGGTAGADAGTKGLAYFADLNKAGNFVPVIGKAATVAQGTSPIVAAWDYNALAWRDGFAGNPKAQVIVPSDSVVAGVYIQAISAYAPHPNAAKLWEEYLYSDEGQLLWLAGYCHPIRFNDLASRNVIPKELLDKLPDPALYAKAVFPTLDEQAAAKDAITKGWDATVGANVQ